jgi:lantibiotic modifying enzyme
MLEAWALDGDTRLRDAARAAFAFEDSLFSAPAANWLDTRSPYRSEGGVLHGVCRTTWCHGAPGIALARIRARQLDTARAAEHERMIGIAVGTTSKQLDELLAAPGADATLCHGISGLLEVLLRYALLTADANASRAVSESALRLAGMYDQVSEWPSGINAGGPNPSLMVGTAGIGYELLRIESPRSVRPVLLVEPASPG